MILYIPDSWIKHPENKGKIDKLIAEYKAVHHTSMTQGREDELDRKRKTLEIIRQLIEMGETEIAAYLRP